MSPTDDTIRRGKGPQLIGAPLTESLIEYNEVVAVTKSLLRCGPPNATFEASSGRRNLPINVPSGSKQWTPSPAAAQMRPASSRRMPSNLPTVASAKTSPPERVPSPATANLSAEKPAIAAVDVLSVRVSVVPAATPWLLT